MGMQLITLSAGGGVAMHTAFGDAWELGWFCGAQGFSFDPSVLSFPLKGAACLARLHLGYWFLGKPAVVVFLFANSVVTNCCIWSFPYFGGMFVGTSKFSRSSREIYQFKVQQCLISNELA